MTDTNRSYNNRDTMRNNIATHFTFALLLIVGATTAPAAAQIDPRAVLKTVFPENIERELALSGAPEHLRTGATVYVFGAKGYTRVQTGTNGFTCLLNRDGFFYNASAFKPTCWDAEGGTSYVPVMLRVGELLAGGKTIEEIRADIDAGFKEGRFNRARRTGVAYMLAGDLNLDTSTGKILSQAFPGHYMIYAPGVASADLGYSAEARKTDASLPFIFRSGAGGAELGYLIIVPQRH
jgi:hypothetical protein